MAQQVDIEKDPFLVLLTDALRAGPGSPEWRDAVSKLKAGGEQTDEYRLLIDAREALESGKEYRSVRAGPGFTRKLLSSLDNERAGDAVKRPFPITTLVAALAGLVILLVAAVSIYELYPRGEVTQGTKAIDDLSGTYLPDTVLSSTFDAGIPAGWRKIGSLPLQASNELKPGSGADMGGGVVISEPLPSSQTSAIGVMVHVAKSGDDLIPQVFVSNSADFSADRATSAQELVWQLKGTEQTVVVGGRVDQQGPLTHGPNLSVRIVFNRDIAIVEADGRRVWAGAHGLGTGARYVGVRFIRTSANSESDIAVQSVRVQKK